MNSDDLRIEDGGNVFYIDSNGVLELIEENCQQGREIEALKESINEALASIPAYDGQGFYFEHHDINGKYLCYSSIQAEDVA